jgi:LacI family transcriptional regulator
MTPSIEEIANRLNLDKSTVSRALNGKPGRMSEATRRRVLDEAAKIGYVPNPMARALARGRTGSVGFVCRQFTDDLYAAVLQAVAVAVDDAGENLVTCITGRDPREEGQASLLHTGRVDGILAIPHALPGLEATDSPWRRAP